MSIAEVVLEYKSAKEAMPKSILGHFFCCCVGVKARKKRLRRALFMLCRATFIAYHELDERFSYVDYLGKSELNIPRLRGTHHNRIPLQLG